MRCDCSAQLTSRTVTVSNVSSLLPVIVLLHLWIRTAPSREHSQLDTCSQETYLLTITHTVIRQNSNLCSRITLCTHTHIYIYIYMHIRTHLTCLNWICYWFILRPSTISSDSLFPAQCILAVSLRWLVTHKAGRDKYRCLLSGRFFRNLLVAKSICLQMMRPHSNNRIYKKWP